MTYNQEAYDLANAAHKVQWDSRAQARDAILAHYGVKADWSGNFGVRLEGGIAEHWDRKVRLEFNSADGWCVGTTGAIWKPEDFARFALECREVELCMHALHAIGDVGEAALKDLPFSTWRKSL